MNPKFTDEAVADLPLRAARAELLEEIMSTPAAQPTPGASPSRPPRRWLIPMGVAAAVAALVIVPVWLLGGQQEPQPIPETPPAAAPAVPVAHDWVVLTAHGWDVDYVSRDGVEREIRYTSGKSSLSVNLRPARGFDSYVEDRQHINYPKREPGERVVLLGQDARLWAYSPQDHATIGAVDGKTFPEVRGFGMDRTAYDALLTQLSWTDQSGYEAALPESFVTSEESGPRIAEMLADIELAPGAETPTSKESDPYQFGADVAGQVVCGWINEYARATDAGDQAAAKKAQESLSTTREWPFLVEMAQEGDYPEVVWEYADEVGAGTVPAGYKQGIGCQ